MEDNFIKIINITYRILDFFPDGDPLKNRSKDKVLAILENLTLISNTRGWVSLQKEKASAQLLDDINVLESYLKFGKYQGWIDSVNFLILTKEYDKIKKGINPPLGIIKKSIEIASKAQKENTVIAISDKSIETGQSLTIGSQQKRVEDKHDRLVTDDKYSERQKKILQILSRKEKAQVSDLIKELPNITKRTVRRDLDNLLKRGKILRFGEWNQIFYKSRSNMNFYNNSSGTAKN